MTTMLQDQTMEGAVVVMNKRGIERGEEGENKISWEGGPTKLPERGGGQQQRPGKEEPLVGRRQEGAGANIVIIAGVSSWWGFFAQ